MAPFFAPPCTMMIMMIMTLTHHKYTRRTLECHRQRPWIQYKRRHNTSGLHGSKLRTIASRRCELDATRLCDVTASFRRHGDVSDDVVVCRVDVTVDDAIETWLVHVHVD